MSCEFNKLTPREAANLIKNNQCIAFGGFSPAGGAKAIPIAISEMAEELHKKGNEFRVRVLTGASTGDAIDGRLARANAILSRLPYQSSKDLRSSINSHNVEYSDLHLANYVQSLDYGFLGKIDYAIIEVSDYNKKGELVLTTAVGASPSFCKNAEKIILEHNKYHPDLNGLHDIYTQENPPHRKPILLEKVTDRIGSFKLVVDPSKIVGVVENNEKDSVSDFKELSCIHEKIGQNVAKFFVNEMGTGSIPKSFLPIQSGVGNIANAVLKTMGEINKIPVFSMYSEVLQDSVIELMKLGRINFASATSLTITEPKLKEIYADFGFYKNKLVLRPENISNNPEIIRRIGLISINTASEVDLFGNVNSTHTFGNNLMNGIGGSGDFTRNAYISIFTLPSTAKDGMISGIVPFCSHIDHTEHDVQVIITEQGIADLRGKDPANRAQCIIDNCVHPEYKQLLRDYLKINTKGHITHDLNNAFSFHEAFLKLGDMRSCKFK